jgi:hypothetical protein
MTTKINKYANPQSGFLDLLYLRVLQSLNCTNDWSGGNPEQPGNLLMTIAAFVHVIFQYTELLVEPVI